MRTGSKIVADVVIIGGGLVGCATAYALAKDARFDKIVVVEKEPALAAHQSGRNSGVLHSGIYYRPGSQKATTCREGKELLHDFCRGEGIALDICGKIIVATHEHEIATLHQIHERGLENEVENTLLDTHQIRELEPAVEGREGIHVPSAGIVDFPGVCRRLGEKVKDAGHEIITDAEVGAIESFDTHIQVRTDRHLIEASVAINCAGLYADRVARMAGQSVSYKIVPFRGLYYELKPEKRHLCNNLIYPVPDPAFPFLGVHFTRTADGRIECGPNAVLASGREAYTFAQTSFSDVREYLGFSGFRHLSRKHWRKGVDEVMRTVSTSSYVKELKRLVPSIKSKDVVRTRSGIRAQAIDPSGNLIEDFLFAESNRMISVCNAPSPAATACLRIGEIIAERASISVIARS